MLARDSIVYFIVVFGSLLLCVIGDFVYHISVSLAITTQCMASIAVGRMIINIRGLILEDRNIPSIYKPSNSPGGPVHAQTLNSMLFVLDNIRGT